MDLRDGLTVDLVVGVGLVLGVVLLVLRLRWPTCPSSVPEPGSRPSCLQIESPVGRFERQRTGWRSLFASGAHRDCGRKTEVPEGNPEGTRADNLHPLFKKTVNEIIKKIIITI